MENWGRKGRVWVERRAWGRRRLFVVIKSIPKKGKKNPTWQVSSMEEKVYFFRGSYEKIGLFFG
jgi:hypothetical protein